MKIKKKSKILLLVINIITILLLLGLASDSVLADNPTSFDWRNHNSQNWMTSVKDQGTCGSCWAFSSVGIVEAVYNIRQNNPNLNLNLSEEELTSDCLSYNDCCGGTDFSALNYIKNNGIVDETCFPYGDTSCVCPGGSCACTYSGTTRCSDTICSDKCVGGDEYFIKAAGRISSDQELIKEFLISRGPLSVSMRMAWPDCGFDGDNIYRCDPDSPANHGVIIVGYDNTGGYWIVKNSWGSGWGPDGNGYFKVGYGEAYIEQDANFANTEMDCGATITEDTTLTSDLINCSGWVHGLTIGADNITLDCDNHSITAFEGLAGIYLLQREGVTIKNCDIQEFDAGIYLYGSSNNNLIDNNLENNGCGAYLTTHVGFDPNSYNTITGNSIVGSIYDGIFLGNSQNNTIWDNSFIDNETSADESFDSIGNNWDLGEIGNYWSDFASNIGFPNIYNISGPGDGVDNYPVGRAGYLCTADADCASGLYCSGSISNPARCGVGEPTPDSWYGGGNIPGCNPDPDSEYRDYYYNESGDEGYELIGDPFNCDADDDCGDNCPALGERTDYYVEENTNNCLFTTFDADDDETSCTDCMGNNYWNLGGDIGQCCSDDTDENILTRVCELDSCNSDPTDDACCGLDNKCVYNSQCYEDGYIGDVDGDSKDEICTVGIWTEEAVNFVPLPISPGVDGQMVDPFHNGYINRFSDLWFVWERIDEAAEYQISLAYDGDLGERYEMDPILYEILPRELLEQPPSGNPKIVIPNRQIPKQMMGAYRWKIAAKVDSIWYKDDVWYNFTLDMIPAITTPDAVISEDGDRLSWNLTKHNLAAEGIPVGNKPEKIIIRLRGTTSGTLCPFASNDELPAYCYIQYPYNIGKNYFEFDERNFDPHSEFFVPKGDYKWSITFLEGELSYIPAAKLKFLKKLKFGPIENFTVT